MKRGKVFIAGFVSSLLVVESLLSPVVVFADSSNGSVATAGVKDGIGVDGGRTALEADDGAQSGDTDRDGSSNDPLTSSGVPNLGQPDSASDENAASASNESSRTTEAPGSVSDQNQNSEAASTDVTVTSEEKDSSAVPEIGSYGYSAHVQDIGWQGYVSKGDTAGTTGKARRIEALKVKLTGEDGMLLSSDSVQVKSHIADLGWESKWVGNNQISGTVGKSRAVEAVKIKLSDTLSSKYDIWYRVHSASFGWLGWARNGETAGTEGYARQVEAIQILVLPKDSSEAPQHGNSNINRSDEAPSIKYRTHLSNVGWGKYSKDGSSSGSSSRSNSIEAIQCAASWYGHSGEVQMRGHISGLGWQSWSNSFVGSTGKGRNLEAVQIKLSGDLASQYNVWYRVKSSDLGGWLGWAANGEPCGSTGKSAPIQTVEIRLVKKGGNAPGATDRHFVGDADILKGGASGLNGGIGARSSGKSIVIGSFSGKSSVTSIVVSLENQETAGSISYDGYIEGAGWLNRWSGDGNTLNSRNDGRPLKAVKFKLSGAVLDKYDIWYRCCDASGWYGWASNGKEAGVLKGGRYITAIEIKLLNKNSGAPGSTESTFVQDDSEGPHVEYQGHSANSGWLAPVIDGRTCGITGHSLSLQAVSVFLKGDAQGSTISARAHLSGLGWQDWSSSGMVGTVGQNRPIEALQFKINGELSKSFDIYYRVHSAHYGWLGWAKNGSTAGTTGIGVQAEAVQIVLVAKGGKAPTGSGPASIEMPNIIAQAHVADIGWMGAVKSNDATIGTTGQARAIEAIRLNTESSLGGGISYSMHMQDIGWQNWVSNGHIGGTTGLGKRTEAVKIKLTGKLADYFDVWYRAYCEDYGWLGWTCNGSAAGTSKVGYRLESLQVKILPKGSVAPGSTDRAYTEQPSMPSDMRAMLNRANWYSSNTGWLIMVDTQGCKLGVFRGQRGSWGYAQYWPCSTGASSTPTVLGEYSVTGKGYSFGHGYTCYYYTQFYGDYLIHSGTYYQGTFNVMDDRMGVHISQGCVRLLIDRAKWIWDNVPIGTKVVTY